MSRYEGGPRVSAIMPTYNAAHALERAISSVRAQILGSWELIIVDDGSTDGTHEVISAAARRDPRIRSIRFELNRGRGVARNAAVTAATGQYLAVCDSDDISLPARFERQADYLDHHADIGVVASQVLHFEADAVPRLRVLYPVEDAAIRARLARGKSAVPNQAAMIRRSVFDAVGCYNPALRRCQDFEFFLRAQTVTAFHTLEEPLVLYRQGDITLKYWRENALYQRYAGYLRDTREAYVTVEEFARLPRVRAQLTTRELLSFLRFRHATRRGSFIELAS